MGSSYKGKLVFTEVKRNFQALWHSWELGVKCAAASFINVGDSL